MRSAETVLGVIRERGKRRLPLEDIYRQLYNPDRYLCAYGGLYRNDGALPPGATAETVDAMSLEKIERIITALRYERYRWTPVWRTFIPKKSGKLRPLGLPSWSDKVLQDVIRAILEAYYEPQFSPHAHGFRPGRGCHTALREITTHWKGVKWFIEGDIAQCFDSLDHTVMLAILREQLHDQRFLRLIAQLLQAGYLQDWRFHATLSGVPQGGVVSPPTKLQTFFFGIVITWIWVDPKHDIDFVTRDFDPLDQRPDEVALARPVGGLQAVAECGGKILQTADDQLQLPLQGSLVCQRSVLFLEASKALAQAGHPGFKLALVEEARSVTVDQAGHALAQLADLTFHRSQRGTFGTRLRLQPAPIFLGEPLRVGQQGTDFPPDRQSQQIGPHLRILTEALAPKAIRIRAQAAVIGVGAGVAFAGARAQACAIEGIATVLALQQALQQRQGAPARLPGMPLVFWQLCLDRREHFGLHERWDRNRAPVLWRDIADGDGTTRLHGPVALGPPPGPQGLQAGLAKRRGALIGRILQEAPHHTPIPYGPARAGHLTRLGQPPTDLPHRQAVLAHPGKDLTDHAGFVWDDLIAGLSTPFIFGHIAVPIGGPAEHIDGTKPSCMTLATPMTLDELGPFILSAHSLYLQQQVVFGALAQGAVEEDHLHPRAAELIDPQDLIRVFAGQAIGRVHIEPVHTARGHHIPQALQRRADQRGPTIAFVKKLHGLGHAQPIDGHARLQGCDLTRNGVCLRLLLRRHAGVYRDLYGIHACCLLPT